MSNIFTLSEQKARSTYEYLLDLIDDPDAADPIKFLREREVVHFQRFGEALEYVEDYYNSKRMFVFPPAGDGLQRGWNEHER